MLLERMNSLFLRLTMIHRSWKKAKHSNLVSESFNLLWSLVSGYHLLLLNARLNQHCWNADFQHQSSTGLTVNFQLAIDGISTAFDATPAVPSSTPMRTSFFLATGP